jgi:HTH-type transcriptional regulator/antitoxin HigA
MPARQKTNRYFDLVEIFPPRPIRSARDMGRAQKIVNELLDRDGLDKDERDYLEVLGTLIEAYEEVHEPMPDISDAAMLSQLASYFKVSPALFFKAQPRDTIEA